MNGTHPMALPTAHTRRRVSARPPRRTGVVVIGAGLGGLMAGALLARHGADVTVLDGHYVAGGSATMFARRRGGDTWCFDVGVHYVGEAGPRQRMSALLQAADAQVGFLPLDPDGFDRLHLPGLSFAIPWSIEAFRERLVEAFPRERRGIDRYVRVLTEVEDISRAMRATDGRPGPRALLHLLARGRGVLRYRNASVAQLLDDCTRTPLLRAVLLGQHGDYGVAPSRASAIAHLAVAAHYFRGGWYPSGGGQALADALAASIERYGGRLCLRRAVARVLVENGRAVGVVTDQGDEVRAHAVLSNADLTHTLRDLLPPDVLPARVRRLLDGWSMAAGILLLCLGVRGDLSQRLRPGNDWIASTTDVEALYRAIAVGDTSPGAICLTSGTVKDPRSRSHAPLGASTLELMALVPGDPTAWGVGSADIASRRYRYDPTYRDRKRATEERMLDLAERILPGLRDDIVLRESATPVTHTRYTRATAGTPYGLAAIPAQLGANRPDAISFLPGLFLCGASTRSGHGVIGTLHGGLRAARVVGREVGVAVPAV